MVTTAWTDGKEYRFVLRDGGDVAVEYSIGTDALGVGRWLAATVCPDAVVGGLVQEIARLQDRLQRMEVQQ